MDDTTRRPSEPATGPPDLEEVSAALYQDQGIDDSRVVLAVRGGQLVVGGSVGSQEEADRVLLVAERFGAPVVDRLQVDLPGGEPAERGGRP